MKRKAYDSHHKEKRYSTFVFIPHSGKYTRTFRITSPITKIAIVSSFFILVTLCLCLMLGFFIQENKGLESTLGTVIEKNQAQVAALNSFLDRQQKLLESKADELEGYSEYQDKLAVNVKVLTTQVDLMSAEYIYGIVDSTQTIDATYERLDEFLASVNLLSEALDKVNLLVEDCDTQLADFDGIKNDIQSYLEYVPSFWPADSTYISDGFGMRWHPILKEYKNHDGLDIGGAYNENIYASASGKVILSGVNGGYGNCIKIDHGDGIVSIYGHCNTLLVKVGETVEKGDIIALVGSTGVSTGPHLHFEIRIDNVPVNPLAFIGNEE